MPISSTYDFVDGANAVTITVPLKGSTYDVELCDLYLKINQQPYLLALDLFAEVDVGSAEVTVDHDARLITCVLRKAAPGAWPGAACAPAPQAALRERREASQARRAALDEQSRGRIKDAKRAREQAELKAQMDVDRRKREALEAAQAEEKSRAQSAVFETFKALTLEAEASAAVAAKASSSSSSSEAKAAAAPVAKAAKPAVAPAVAASAAAAAASSAAAPSAPSSSPPQRQEPGEVQEETLAALPPPRTFARLQPRQQQQGAGAAGAPAPAAAPAHPPTLSVTFTPRVFPSPLRESRAQEEDNWLARNYSKIKENHDAGRGSGNLSFVERSPAWLKSKAEDFVRLGDWDSACSAYASACAASPADAALHLNKAACHLHRLRGEQCAEDCGTALELLLGGTAGARCPPERVPAFLAALAASDASDASDASARTRALCLKALSRRMVARCLQGRFSSALEDAGAARALARGGEEAGYFEQCAAGLAPLAGAEAAKGRGDACARAGDALGALAHYATATAACPAYAVARLNSSAVLFGLGRWAECARECRGVLRTLGSAHEAASVEEPVRGAPPLGSELAAQVRLRASSRLEEALRSMGGQGASAGALEDVAEGQEGEEEEEGEGEGEGEGDGGGAEAGGEGAKGVAQG